MQRHNPNHTIGIDRRTDFLSRIGSPDLSRLSETFHLRPTYGKTQCGLSYRGCPYCDRPWCWEHGFAVRSRKAELCGKRHLPDVPGYAIVLHFPCCVSAKEVSWAYSEFFRRLSKLVKLESYWWVTHWRHFRPHLSGTIYLSLTEPRSLVVSVWRGVLLDMGFCDLKGLRTYCSGLRKPYQWMQYCFRTRSNLSTADCPPSIKGQKYLLWGPYCLPSPPRQPYAGSPPPCPAPGGGGTEGEATFHPPKGEFPKSSFSASRSGNQNDRHRYLDVAGRVRRSPAYSRELVRYLPWLLAREQFL